MHTYVYVLANSLQLAEDSSTRWIACRPKNSVEVLTLCVEVHII